MNVWIRAVVLAAAVWVAACAPATAGFMGPFHYSGFSDSPFSSSLFNWFYVEDFEDGALNTPGVTLDNGFVTGNTPTSDSVDEDDGVLDGFGGTGWSLTSVGNEDGVNSFMFTFQPEVLGGYPTHVGIVFTDGTPNTFFTFQPFDANGASLGSLNAFVGDDSFNGQTAEDTFFGAVHAEGVSRFFVTDNGGALDIELDHLQYGSPVPEPSSVWLGLAVACFAAWLGAARWGHIGSRTISRPARSRRAI